MGEGEKKVKEKVRKYLSGYVEFGILGRREICIFKNEGRESDKQPSFRIFVKEGEAWKEVGALWTRELKEKEGDEIVG
ncbi:MAG: DUF736 family protein [Archaeoglobaceae archaeon]